MNNPGQESVPEWHSSTWSGTKDESDLANYLTMPG